MLLYIEPCTGYRSTKTMLSVIVIKFFEWPVYGHTMQTTLPQSSVNLKTMCMKYRFNLYFMHLAFKLPDWAAWSLHEAGCNWPKAGTLAWECLPLISYGINQSTRSISMITPSMRFIVSCACFCHVVMGRLGPVLCHTVPH